MSVLATSAQAYTFTGCKWGSAQISIKNTTLSGTYLTTAGAAQTAWSNTTDVQINTAVSSNWSRFTAADGATGLDGVTTWTCSGGTFGTVGSHLNTSQVGSYVANKKQAIWAHEMGHGLGLNHSTSTTIMYTSPATVYNNHGYYTPRADDIAGVNALY